MSREDVFQRELTERRAEYNRWRRRQDWRSLAFALGGIAIGGVIVAAFTLVNLWIISR